MEYLKMIKVTTKKPEIVNYDIEVFNDSDSSPLLDDRKSFVSTKYKANVKVTFKKSNRAMFCKTIFDKSYILKEVNQLSNSKGWKLVKPSRKTNKILRLRGSK
tara:strand:+ start:663 stop:971 length:309 start_codon:yes stop_codon:yes gene_type:complete